MGRSGRNRQGGRRHVYKETAPTHAPGPEDDPANRRSAPRFTLLIRTAKLVLGEREYLCIIRDASRTGVKLRLFNELPQAEGFELELANGERFAVEPVWMSDDHAGFRFPEEIDVVRLIDPNRGPYPNRKLRLRTLITGELGWGHDSCDIVFENLSQQGAGIICDERLAIDQLVRVRMGPLPQFYAKVRWRKKPHYGLIFEQTLTFEELARLVASPRWAPAQS